MSACAATRADGTACRAHPVSGEAFCFTHHPDREQERAVARRAGGQARAASIVPASTPERSLRTASDVTALLSDVIGHVLQGELDTRTATAIGYLSTVLLKSLQVGELEDRLARIEAAVRPGVTHGLVDRESGDTPLLLLGEGA